MRKLQTITLLLIWSVLLLGGAFRPKGFAAGDRPRPEVGHRAPRLTATTLDGQSVTLADLKGKAVFLNFWASWCGPCQMEMPEMERLAQALPTNTAILAVNMTPQETSPEAVTTYLKAHGYTFPVALDPSGQAGTDYRAASLPTSLFISPDGMVTARIAGPLSHRAMADYLAAAAAATAVEPGEGGLLSSGLFRALSPGAHLPGVIPVGPASLPTGALFWLAGGLVAYLLAGNRARRAGLAAEGVQDLVVNLGIGLVLGAKLIYVLTDLPSYIANPRLLLIFPYGSLALPGAALGGLALAGWGLRRLPHRWAALDAGLPALLVGAAVGIAGSAGPSSGLMMLLLLVAGVATAWLAPRPQAPGQIAVTAALTAAAAVVVADLARPAAALGGVTGLQLAAALLGTVAWYWQRKNQVL